MVCSISRNRGCYLVSRQLGENLTVKHSQVEEGRGVGWRAETGRDRTVRTRMMICKG